MASSSARASHATPCPSWAVDAAHADSETGPGDEALIASAITVNECAPPLRSATVLSTFAVTIRRTELPGESWSASMATTPGDCCDCAASCRRTRKRCLMASMSSR